MGTQKVTQMTNRFRRFCRTFFGEYSWWVHLLQQQSLKPLYLIYIYCIFITGLHPTICWITHSGRIFLCGEQAFIDLKKMGDKYRFYRNFQWWAQFMITTQFSYTILDWPIIEVTTRYQMPSLNNTSIAVLIIRRQPEGGNVKNRSVSDICWYAPDVCKNVRPKYMFSNQDIILWS